MYYDSPTTALADELLPATQVEVQPAYDPLPQPVSTDARSIDITGNIFDAATQAPVMAQGSIRNVRTGEVYGQWTSTSYRVWNNDTDIPNADLQLIIGADGYATQKLTIAQIALQPDIFLKKGSGIAPYLMAAAVLGFIAFAKKKKKQVGKVTTADVFPFLLIGGGLLAFSLVKKLLESLGIWDSADTHHLNDTSTDPGSFWNPNFWRLKPDNIPFSYVVTTPTATAWVDEIWDAVGAFNDCESCIIAVFKRCHTQANASFLCDVFQARYGKDLLTWLRGGFWPYDHLSDSDVNTITNYVSNLPKY
jgi:hypothetical protein